MVTRFTSPIHLFLALRQIFFGRSGLIERGVGYLRIITRVSGRLRRNSTKVAAAALLYFAIAPGAGAADGSSLTSFTDPATQATPAELQAPIADAATAAPESQAPATEMQAPAPEMQAPAAESEAPAAESQPPAVDAQAPSAQQQAPAVDPPAGDSPEATPPATTKTLQPDVAPVADSANSVKENSGHEFTQSSVKEAVSPETDSVIPTPENRAIPPAGAPASGQENKAPIRRLIASGIKQARHGEPSALRRSFSSAKSRMNTGSRGVEGSNSQPRTEVASPREQAAPQPTGARVKRNAAGAGNPRPQAANPQYRLGNPQYQAAERLVERVGPSAEVWFATRSGGVDAWLVHAGAKFDWPRINTFATDTAIGAIAVGARAEAARDTTANSPDHPVTHKPASGGPREVAARSAGGGSAGSAGSTASATRPLNAGAGAAALGAQPPTRAAPKRLAARHEPPARELSNSRLIVQLGLLLALVYLAFVICWLLARSSRPRMPRRGLRA